MTYRHLTLTSAAAIVALTTTGVAQQEVRITQGITQEITTLGPGAAGPGGALKPMPLGTGLIFGRATDAGSTRPIPGALITLTIPGTTPIRALADAEGRFAFRDLPRGRFNLAATKPGYVDGAYGRMRPAGPTLSLELGESERVSGVTIPLWKYAAIAGLVVDEQGDPLVNSTVRVLKRTIVGGQWRLTPGAQDTTDDRGVYRIGMLEPGEYVVAVPMNSNMMMIDMPAPMADAGRDVTVTFIARAAAVGGAVAEAPIMIGGMDSPNAGMSEDGHPLAFPTQFYPASLSSARATIITLGSGEERTSVDFQLKAVRTTKITGVAVGPEGPVGGLQITLAPSEASDLITAIETVTTVSGEGGLFTFASVPAGQYTLRATRNPRMMVGGGGETTTIAQGGAVMVTRMVAGPAGPLPAESTLWAEMTLAVGTGDMSDVPITLRPGLKVTGSVQFDGTTPRPPNDQLPNIGVTLELADVRPGNTPNARGRIEASGAFATVGVPPGRYFVRVGAAPQGWTFRGATLGGRDVTDSPLEIDGDISGVVLTFTDRQTQLSGTVTTENGSPDAATVIAFPTDSAAWVGYGSASRRLRTARVGKNGNYDVGSLPAGEYFVVAIPERMAADWQNPKFLEGLTGDATRVRLADGDKRTLSVKVAR